jgi:tetratricopeptide (TPR) repeat protein
MHPDFSFETLAAFIDGRLDARARKQVAAHLTACGDCYTIFVDVSAARQEIGEADFEPRPFAAAAEPERLGTLLPFRALAAAAAIAAGLAAVFFIPAIRESVPGLRAPGIEELGKVAGPARRTQTRIAGLEHRPPAAVFRGPDGDDDDSPDTLQLKITRGKIIDAVNAHRTVRNLHSLGVAFLMLKDPDEAIAELDRARTAGKPDAALLNDLSAAYVDRAIRRGRTDKEHPGVDYAEKGLAYANLAWDLGKDPASMWNRALALESLERDQEAIAAWSQYLALEKDPEWRKEAEQRLRDLQSLYR